MKVNNNMGCSSILSKWRLWIHYVVMLVYAIVVLMLLPNLVIHSLDKKFKNKDQSAFIGGLFVMMAIPIALWEITQHMIHYTKPILQKHIIRILWMVPIYAFNAWLGLVYPKQTLYVDSLRECYEAYVIYNFMVYLLNYLNGEMDLVTNLSQKSQVHHFFPFCWLSDWKMGRDLVHNCKHGILQYTIVRPFTSAVALICELNGVYGEGTFKGDRGFLYVVFVNNCSQFIAMYCLVLFYKANKEELKPMKPLGKFLCIKAVVFFSFFQGVLIAVLVYSGVISTVFDTDREHTIKIISSNIQNFLICIEMFIAAIAHKYSFSHKPYVNGFVEHKSFCDTFMSMWDVSDIHADIKEHFGIVGNSITGTLNRHIRSHGQPQGNENVPLLNDTPVESGYDILDDINYTSLEEDKDSRYNQQNPNV